MHARVKQILTKKIIDLSATFYIPNNKIKGGVLIVSGMEFTQNYYEFSASWLAGKGYLVVTFDYSRIGLSLKGNSCSNATITNWARIDCVKMADALSYATRGKPLYWIGYSLGGLIAGLTLNINIFSKLITIASESGYWLENVLLLRWRAWMLWYKVMPVFLSLFVCFSGRRLKKLTILAFLKKSVQSTIWVNFLYPKYIIISNG